MWQPMWSYKGKHTGKVVDFVIYFWKKLNPEIGSNGVVIECAKKKKSLSTFELFLLLLIQQTKINFLLCFRCVPFLKLRITSSVKIKNINPKCSS